MEKRRGQIQSYLKQRVNPILQPLTIDLLKSRPENIPNYIIQWFKNYHEHKKNHVDNGIDHSDEENDVVDDIVFSSKVKAKTSKNRNRSGVSAEVYGQFNKKQIFSPKIIHKSEQTQTRILILVRNSILFQNLDEKYLQIIMGAMSQKHFTAGSTIIRQGDDGDELFLVDQGELECFKTIQGKETFLRDYKSGESFGELALMYNAPRAASVKAKTDVVLFGLDRLCFNHIIKQSSIKKRQLFEKTLKKVQLLDSIDPYERTQICDVLKQKKYNVGDYIIRQGDMGDKFFIVLQGKLVAERKNGDGQPQIVYNYKQGDYFGQIALVRNIPRQASVKALTVCTLVSLQRNVFKRILGPIEDILKRNQERYRKFWNFDIKVL